MSLFAFFMPGLTEILLWLVGFGVLAVIVLAAVLVLKKSR